MEEIEQLRIQYAQLVQFHAKLAEFGKLSQSGLPPLGRHAIPSSHQYRTHRVIGREYELIDNQDLGILDVDWDVCSNKTESKIWQEARQSDGTYWLSDWNNASNIRSLVRKVLTDIARLVDIKLDFTMQVCLTLCEHLNPDVTIIKLHGCIVGLCLVNAPHPKGDDLSNEQLVNRVYNYMLQLRYTHCVNEVFAIVTTYNQWKVFWLNEAQTLANATTAMETYRYEHSTDYYDSARKSLYGTPVYKYNTTSLLPFLGSILIKLSFVTSTPPISLSHLSDSSVQRTFGYMNDTSFTYKPLPSPSMNRAFSISFAMSDNASQYYLLQDYHGGRDGRVWLGCSDRGNLAVIKLSPHSTYDNEVSNWQHVHDTDNIHVRTLTLMNCNAMVMPFAFHGYIDSKTRRVSFRSWSTWSEAVSTELTDIVYSGVERLDENEVKKYFDHPRLAAMEAIQTLAMKGMKHSDISWRHVALLPYRMRDGPWSVKPIMIDLHDVEAIGEGVTIDGIVEDGLKILDSELSTFNNV